MQPCRQATNNAISRRKEQRVLPSNEKPLVLLVDFYLIFFHPNNTLKPHGVNIIEFSKTKSR